MLCCFALMHFVRISVSVCTSWHIFLFVSRTHPRSVPYLLQCLRWLLRSRYALLTHGPYGPSLALTTQSCTFRPSEWSAWRDEHRLLIHQRIKEVANHLLWPIETYDIQAMITSNLTALHAPVLMTHRSQVSGLVVKAHRPAWIPLLSCILF